MDHEHEYSPVDDSDEDPHFVPNANEESESLDSSLETDMESRRDKREIMKQSRASEERVVSSWASGAHLRSLTIPDTRAQSPSASICTNNVCSEPSTFS